MRFEIVTCAHERKVEWVEMRLGGKAALFQRPFLNPSVSSNRKSACLGNFVLTEVGPQSYRSYWLIVLSRSESAFTTVSNGGGSFKNMGCIAR
jgi:hypothetical protein